MNSVLFLLAFATTFALFGCNSDPRKSLTGGDDNEFNVYYFDESEADIAKKIAFFWKENGLLTGKKQDLQVRKVKERYTVSMIASKPKEVKSLPIEEIQLLAQLKKKLYVDVFNEKAFTLEICNNRFESIYTVE